MQQNLDRFKYKIAITEEINNIKIGVYNVFSIRWETDGLYVKFFNYNRRGLYADYRLEEVNQNNCKFQLLQSTGLKDEKGCEIFEGDIVQESLECVMNGVLKDAVFYQAIDDNGVVYGKTFYTTKTEFENKFKKFNEK